GRGDAGVDVGGQAEAAPAGADGAQLVVDPGTEIEVEQGLGLPDVLEEGGPQAAGDVLVECGCRPQVGLPGPVEDVEGPPGGDASQPPRRLPLEQPVQGLGPGQAAGVVHWLGGDVERVVDADEAEHPSGGRRRVFGQVVEAQGEHL